MNYFYLVPLGKNKSLIHTVLKFYAAHTGWKCYLKNLTEIRYRCFKPSKTKKKVAQGSINKGGT